MRNPIVVILIAAILCIASFLSGCGNNTALYGRKITESGVTSIGAILADPADFDGKVVKIEGDITEECPSGCWFRLKDESGIMYVNIHPSNLVIPQAQGRRAVVEGVVKKEGLKVSVIGSGVEV